MKIDSHHHFWNYHPKKQDWITEDMQVIRRDFLPEDLEPVFRSNGIDGCVTVQADQTEAETQFLLAQASKYSWIKGVVGWVDLKGKGLEQSLSTFKEHSAFKGVRHVIQGEPDGFMTDPEFVAGLKKLTEFDLTYDILTFERQLPEVVELLEHLPEMKLVMDHISKPNISKHSFDHWAKYMKIISQYDYISVKLSGMVTEADWGNWTADDLNPYIDYCLEHFGPKRLMFGSDWPVCLVAAEYDQVLGVVQKAIGKLSKDEQDWIMGKTASNFYNL